MTTNIHKNNPKLLPSHPNIKMTQKFSTQCALFSLSLLFYYSISAQNLLIPNDASALLAFKSKTDSQNKLNFSPNTALAFCNWTGVQCHNGKPVRLVLERLSLTGVFEPDTLTRLDQLRVLSLRNNSLTGPIPDLSGLPNLKSLFLDHNQFNGSIPRSISTVHRLRTIDLSFNLLAGPMPVSLKNLDRLYYLRLDSNWLTGPVPPLNQSSLKFFNVSKNNLTGPVPVTPVLLRFGRISFLSNPNLCGKIVERECSTKTAFFGTTQAPPPPPSTAGALSQTESTQREAESTWPRSKRTAAIVGFSSGVLILVSSVLCLAAAVKKRRKGREKVPAEAMMVSDFSAAAHVARLGEEDEVGERIRRVQKLQIAKSGSLVFCAGEAQVYTMDELMRASAELLGRGGMGTTYKAVVDNRLIVTVKRLDGVRFGGAGKEEFERHMVSVGGLRHPNLVPVRAYFQAKEEKLVVYDYQPNGSLFSLIHGSRSTRAKPLHWTSCLKIAEDVAQGLSYIHQAWCLIHGNLKSTNVLLGSDFEACLTDYCLSALATSSSDPSENIHKAPEDRNSNHQTTSKSDVYSFGVLLLEILTGEPISQHPCIEFERMINWVKSLRNDKGDGEIQLDMLVDLAVTCTALSADHRPTMWQVLKMIQEVKEAAVVESGELLMLNGASLN